jgi:hypothetical protein
LLPAITRAAPCGRLMHPRLAPRRARSGQVPRQVAGDPFVTAVFAAAFADSNSGYARSRGRVYRPNGDLTPHRKTGTDHVFRTLASGENVVCP